MNFSAAAARLAGLGIANPRLLTGTVDFAPGSGVNRNANPAAALGPVSLGAQEPISRKSACRCAHFSCTAGHFEPS